MGENGLLSVAWNGKVHWCVIFLLKFFFCFVFHSFPFRANWGLF